MVHHRIADQHTFHDIVAVDARLGCDLTDQRVDRFAHGLGHFEMSAWVHHRIGHARHQILAKADLGVHETGGCLDLARHQIAEMAGNRGRTHVEGHPIDRAIMKARPDLNDAPIRAPAPRIDGHRDFPVALTQCRLEHLQAAQIADDVGKLPLLPKCFEQTLEIAFGVVHVGLCDLDVEELGGRIHDDVARLGPFAHDLLVNLAFFGHVNDDIALDLGLTAQSAPVEHAALGLVALLDPIPFGQRILGNGHTVLGKLTIRRLDLTFRTDAAPTAHRIEIHAQLPRRLQNRRTFGKPPPLAGGGEDHKRVVRIGHGLIPRM